MKHPAGRLALAAVGLFIGGVAVQALREATLSTHDPIDPSSRAELILTVRTRGPERTQSIEELVEALLLTCRLEVNADFLRPIEHDGHGKFRATFVPAMDETDRRQFRGCVEDWTIDHLEANVVSLKQLPS